MSHTQYNGFVFHKILRDPHGPLIRWITCILTTMGLLFFWYLFISQREAKAFWGGVAILWSILYLLMMYNSFTTSRPFMFAKWHCSEQTISTDIDGQTNSIDLKDAYFCTKYDTIYESRIGQVFLIFSATPFSAKDFGRNVNKSLHRGFLKGWVIIPECTEIQTFLAHNGRSIQIKNYPSVSYFASRLNPSFFDGDTGDLVAHSTEDGFA